MHTELVGHCGTGEPGIRPVSLILMVAAGLTALQDKPTYTLPPGFAAVALLFSRLLIPIQAAILAFAVRNKLHR